MGRILIVFLFTVTFTVSALSQNQNQPEVRQTCDLSLSQAPVIRGIRLGMKPDDWLKLFPGSAQDEKIKALLERPPRHPEYGLSSISFDSPSGPDYGGYKYLRGEGFQGVASVLLSLFDNQIIGIQIQYLPYLNHCCPWNGASELISIFSETFNLPPDSAWEKNGHQAALKCAGFELVLTAQNGPIARLESKSDFNQIIRQRAEADKQKGRAAFKP